MFYYVFGELISILETSVHSQRTLGTKTALQYKTGMHQYWPFILADTPCHCPLNPP